MVRPSNIASVRGRWLATGKATRSGRASWVLRLLVTLGLLATVRHQGVSYHVGPTLRGCRLFLEASGQPLGPALAMAGRDLIRQCCILLQRAQRGPQRVVEGMRLLSEQRVSGPSVSDATPEANEFAVAYFP